MSWLDELMAATEESESPRQYFYWAGLSAISAIVKRKVYLDRFFYTLYPNIYVMLVGKSGLRKGIPVALAKALVDKVDNTRIIHGRISVQGLIKELSTQFTKPGGVVISDSAGFLVSGEFASFLVEDPQALTILTDLYDGHYNDEWRNTLKGTGTETLKDVCLTMLGASNQVHLKDAIPDNAIGGGFVARTFFILEEKKYKLNSLVRKPTRVPDKDKLVSWLFRLANLEGPMKMDEDAKKAYDGWYLEFNRKEHDDKTGLADRIGDHVLKVAMLISLSRRLSLEIQEDDILDAITACMGFGVDVEKSMISQQSKTQLAHQVKVVMGELVTNPEHKITRSKLLQKYWGDISALELDAVSETLTEANAITVYKVGKDTVYELTEMMLKRYEKIQGNGRGW